MDEKYCIAAVAVEAAPPYPLDLLYSYIVPRELHGRTLEGCRVLVPFGRSNRRRIGLVVSLSEAAPEECGKLKRILAPADDAPVLHEEQLLLLHWLRENTFCSYSDAIRAMVPAAFHLRVQEHYVLLPKEDQPALSEEAAQLLAFLRHARNQKEFDALLDTTATPEKETYRTELLKAGLLSKTAAVQELYKGKKVRMVQLSAAAAEAHSLTVKQKQAVSTLEEYGALAEKELCYICGITNAVVQKLVKQGIVSRYEADVQETIPEEMEVRPALTLSEEQQAVCERVSPFLETDEPKCFLLRGVTGSGKTAVFEALIDRTIALGKSVLLLLPEIGLTPQTVRRFTERFGSRIAVLHSGLTLRERKKSYERAYSGEATLIIGTRSAVFAPLQSIGLIIMDEEGERSYKSENPPRYDTIQVARQRCKYHGAVLLAASATPTLESWYYTQKGVYELLEMKQRYGGAPLPLVETVDMTPERLDGNDSEFSRTLHEAIQENLDRGEQSILLLNRRGFHTIISCCSCNKPVYCDNCSVPMTFHKPDGMLHCHYCGAVRSMPEVCPSCGGEHLRRMGFGTQRLEDELAVRFPTARILRMDADTTTSRHAYEEGFEAFRRGEYDIMLGTQMIGKGLDFPNVTLVGVMSVDKALFAGDIRSYERTFSLIAQVVGRGGRGGKPGRAVLQTFLPEHYVLRLAAAQDYEGFAREELSIRKTLLLPPYCDICVVGFHGDVLEEVQRAADCFVECMKQVLASREEKLPLRVLGPVPCTYTRLVRKYRYRLIIKCKNTRSFREFLRSVMQSAAGMRELSKVHIYVDMNGSIGV